MPSHKLQPSTGELNSSNFDKYYKQNELFSLLSSLSKAPDVAIRIKRIDRLNHGNFSTVVRASGALIMLRELGSGLAEVIPDLRDVQYFELNKDFQKIKGNLTYAVIDFREQSK